MILNEHKKGDGLLETFHEKHPEKIIQNYHKFHKVFLHTFIFRDLRGSWTEWRELRKKLGMRIGAR